MCGPNLYVVSFTLDSFHLAEPVGLPSKASVGSPFTRRAANAVTALQCLYAAKFSGSVIVNVAPGSNVRLPSTSACLPANRSAHEARSEFVTVMSHPGTLPAPPKEERKSGAGFANCNVAPYATRTDVLLGTTPSVSA